MASFDTLTSLPAGLRVLVVETDSEGLKILEKMLIKCKYKATISNSAKEALDLLEKRKEEFDIVLTDVNLPDMDKFMFIEQVGLKMDLPVIVMSLDQETSQMKKGFQHGACEFLRKPIKLWELRNIWKHVFKKRVHEVKQGIEGKESVDQTPISTTTCGIDNSDDSCSSFGGDHGQKRKDRVDRPSSLKKPRVVWTNELHQSFIAAVDRVGLDKAGPKKILDFMGVSWLTRENVASHLQKYRLYLSRQHKEKNLIASDGMTYLQSGVAPSSLTLQQNIVINENYVAPKHELHIHSHNANNYCEGNVMSLPMQTEKVVFDAPTSSSCSRIGYNLSESKIQTHPSIQNRQHTRPYYHFPLASRIHGSPRRETDHQPIESNINHIYNKSRSFAMVTENTGTSNLLPHQNHLANYHTLEPAQCSPWSTKLLTVEQQNNLHNNLEASLKNMTVGTGAQLHDTELNYPYAGDMYLQGDHHSFDCFSQEDFLGDARSELYDSKNIESEYGSNNQWDAM